MMSHQQASTQGQQSSSTTSAVQVKVPKDIEMAENWSNGSSRPQQDPNVVAWNGPRDPENPHNWSTSRRVLNTSMMASMTWVVTFASSVLSSATTSISAEFGVSTEVATLGTSLFVLGFGVGPMVWGPLSELFGRMTPLCIAFTGFAIFQIPVAVAQNVETIMICRFWGGFFGVGPLAICAGAFADMWGPVDRGIAMALFVAATFVGPIMGMSCVRIIHVCMSSAKTYRTCHGRLYYTIVFGLALDCLDYLDHGVRFWSCNCFCCAGNL